MRRGNKSAVDSSSLSLCRRLSRSRKLSFTVLYCQSYMLLLRSRHVLCFIEISDVFLSRDRLIFHVFY